MSHRLPAFPVELAGLRVWSARLRKLLSVSLLIAYLPSCYSYQELGPTPQAALQNPPESTLYITPGRRFDRRVAEKPPRLGIALWVWAYPRAEFYRNRVLRFPCRMSRGCAPGSLRVARRPDCSVGL